MDDSDVLSADFVRLGKKKNEANVGWRFVLAIVTILAGLDKFLGVLLDWDKFFAPLVMSVAPESPHSLMLIVGAVEIAAGIVVATRPRFFWYVLAAWALGIAANLWLLQSYQGDWPFNKLFHIGR